MTIEGAYAARRREVLLSVVEDKWRLCDDGPGGVPRCELDAVEAAKLRELLDASVSPTNETEVAASQGGPIVMPRQVRGGSARGLSCDGGVGVRDGLGKARGA